MVVIKSIKQAGVLVILTGLCHVAMAAASASLDDVARQKIADRIAPVTQICLTGQPCAEVSPVAEESGPTGPRSGSEIFAKHCTVCHSTGVAGAPKKGDTAAWNERLAKEGSFDKLVAQAIKGLGAMPPKGTCADCDDQEIGNALEYMSGLKP